MLDENLPTFYIKPSTDSVKHNSTIYFTQNASEAAPAYSIRHPDPSSPESRNRYAAALYDSYNADVLFGEVLLIPEWTQPSLSAEEIRQNSGIPPPPQPILPSEFTIQLYNPDQQVLLRYHPGSWNTSPYWEFEMPQQTFRQPSTSALDRVQSDPTASETTPKIDFKWKKEGKLSKDLICNLSGKSTKPDGSKKKNKEPDIAICFFRHLREITIYEPNLYRVEMEDLKGLEVVLLLSAAVIRDVYFTPMKETFNITDMPRRSSNDIVPGRRSPLAVTIPSGRVPASQRPLNQTSNTQQIPSNQPNSRLPPTDPRSQWEIDAETARLKKQVEREEKGKKRREDAELARVKAMLEAEENASRRKQAEIDKETERLRKEYAAEAAAQQRYQEQRPNLPPRINAPHRNSAPQIQPLVQPLRPQSFQPHYFQPQPFQQPYLQAPPQIGRPSSAGGYYPNPGYNQGGLAVPQQQVKNKTTFFGRRSHSDQSPKLQKKKSFIF
ncbi:MAG: hypothetical protein MMC33_001347 [Icmadophila ericetorum]|nr:hypothetical protein [Icmadophila ericetorum]